MFAFTPQRNAEREKDRGNVEFRAQRYPSAIDAYSRALQTLLEAGEDLKEGDKELMSQIYSNRSAASTAYGMLDEALRDAESAIELKPDWPKAYSRKGKALFALKQYKQAASAYSRGLEKTVDTAKAEQDKQKREIEALRKQAGAQSGEYLRVMEENAALRRRLEDYEIVFGAGRQKKQA